MNYLEWYEAVVDMNKVKMAINLTDDYIKKEELKDLLIRIEEVVNRGAKEGHSLDK